MNHLRSNLIAVYYEIIEFLDKGKSVDVTYLDFNKTLDTVSHAIHVFNRKCYNLYGWTTGKLKDSLDGWPYRVLVNGSYSTQTLEITGVSQESVV